MMLKFILCALSILIMEQSFSQDVNHIRFFRGYKQDNVPYKTFVDNISSTLIPITVEVGGNKGLNAYLPTILPENKESFLPDEIAILTYETLEAYTALTKSAAWEIYGPLHYADGYFARESRGKKSGSLVVGNKLPEDLSKPFAYKISSIDGQFKTHENSIYFLTFKQSKAEQKSACLKNLDALLRDKSSLNLSSTIMFDVEYVALLLTGDAEAPRLYLSNEVVSCFKVSYEGNYIKDTRIDAFPGSLNFQF